MSLYQIIILGVLVVLSGVFSGMETAVMSLNEAKVRALVKQKKKGSKALYRVKKNTHKLLITILIGNNLVNIGSASLATVVFTELFGSAGLGIATGVMTFLILLFGEITPKTFASQNAEKISLIVARPLELLSIILSPVVFLFELISRFVSKILGSKEGEDLSEEELRTVVTMGARGGILNKEAAKMMHNVLEFKETKLSEIMTPRIGMKLIDGNKNLKKVLPFVIKTPYSRYPVYLKNKDNIIGILDVDDVLRFVKNNKLDS
jgi:putative hemolysin